ncbi:MAG: flavodoxin family protein [Nitrososphaerota archaeon]|jgi:multimeric flavodoxin WrbA|nr:flavodoxin family protein [Nitrososphaerota archaeon]
MVKKVIVLNGGPRVGGNTDMLIDAFVEGAVSVGHIVKQFDLRDMNIKHCKGCQRGGKNRNINYPCAQHDDMDKIYPQYIDADVVVFASPLYCWGWTAYLKNAFDRLYAVTEASSKNGTYNTPHKECVMLIAAEGDYPENFALIVNYYESILNYLKWTNKGKVLAGGVINIGDINDKPSLQEAKKLATTL